MKPWIHLPAVHGLLLCLGLMVCGCAGSPQPITAPAERDSVPIEFHADRSIIKVGMCVNFTWEVEEAKAVYFYAEGEPWPDNRVPGKETRQVCLKETTTYFLRVAKPDDTIEIKRIRIPVEAMPGL